MMAPSSWIFGLVVCQAIDIHAFIEHPFWAPSKQQNKLRAYLRSQENVSISSAWTHDPFLEEEIGKKESAALGQGHDRIFEKNEMDQFFSSRDASTKEAEQRAIDQIEGIMDLYKSTGIHMSDQMLSSAIEGILRRIYRDGSCHGEILNQLESIIWRCHDLKVVPTPKSLETLWMLQQRHCDHLLMSADEVVERSILLLSHWLLMSRESNLPIPPFEIIKSTFGLVRETNLTKISYQTWGLYEDFRYAGLPREFFTIMLDILSGSPTEWKVRQCTVLQDMERIHHMKNDSSYIPSIPEMESALWVASEYGSAPEATWLFRSLCDRQSDATELQLSYMKAWFESLCRNRELGSLTYLEKLIHPSNQILGENNNVMWSRLRHREYYNMVLQGWSRMKTAGSGMRAQRLFEHMATHFRNTGDENMRPDAESVHHVVMAYIHEERASIQQLSDARLFMEQAVQNPSISHASEAPNRNWRTCDILMEEFSKSH